MGWTLKGTFSLLNPDFGLRMMREAEKPEGFRVAGVGLTVLGVLVGASAWF